eukprot:Hpha_TRINITY_DN16144_c1_g3::TRINITY_DN16144_c1_g3_i2::g.4624::m.4624/K17533/MAP3K19, YSK4; mitogen-activated protein kinase kinase kinase 19
MARPVGSTATSPQKEISTPASPNMGDDYWCPPGGRVSSDLRLDGNSASSQAPGRKDEASALRKHIELAMAPKGGSDSSSNSSSSSSPEGGVPNEVTDAGGTQYWRSEKRLGKGAAGEVWLGMGDFGGLVALKYLKLPRVRSPKGRKPRSSPLRPGGGGRSEMGVVDQLVTEVHLMSRHRHDNIVGYLGSAVRDMYVVIAMECVSGGSLQQVIENFGGGERGGIPTPSAKRYTKDMLRGLEYLHTHGIVHRDVKPGNVLLTIDGTAKLADFGESAMLTTLGRCGAVVGTPLFMAPEAAKGQGGKPSDVWSFGLAFLQMVTGKNPLSVFKLPNRGGSESDEETERQVDMNWFMRWVAREASAVPVVPSNLPETMRAFIELCVRRDQTLRATATDLLAHPFVAGE